MRTNEILEELSTFHKTELELLFNAILNAKLPSEYVLGEAKALNEFKDIIISKSLDVISLKAYATKIGFTEKKLYTESGFDYLMRIQAYAEENDRTLWDYPLSELDHVKENGSEFVPVFVGDKIRLCEV